MKKNHKNSIYAAAGLSLAALAGWTLWENITPEANHIVVPSPRLPKAFDGFRIAHVSDLHNASFGAHNKKLLTLLKNTQPDIIAITGDMINSYHLNLPVALAFARAAVSIAPCYYVPGNHESRVPEYAQLKKGLTQAGVIVLENSTVMLTRETDVLTIAGVIDPCFTPRTRSWNKQAIISQALTALIPQKAYTVLLSHRPELFDTYTSFDVDLVLAGHAHGGQFRLPFLGGVLSPSQGFFPKYDAGLYTKEQTNMVVSRGIGNSFFPIRFNNRPEIILVELRGVGKDDLE